MTELPRHADGASLPEPSRKLLDRLRGELDVQLDRYLKGVSSVALLMFPYDGNVGNHMMWIAITDYLRGRGIRLAYAAHGNNFDVDQLRRAIGGGVIMFIGGVTVSRLWPRHAEIKREVAASFPDNLLLSLPSTMLFVDEADRQGAADIWGDHKRVVVMARDPFSMAQAKEIFPAHVEVVTVPDLAFRLPPQPRRSAASENIIWLARNDVEAASDERPPPDVHVFDWPYLDPDIPVSHALLRVSNIFSRLRATPLHRVASPALNLPIGELYRLASHGVLRYGNARLDRGKVLVTDRFHPHVLAALRGQYTVLLPDKFGKNRSVYERFSHEFSTVRWADNPAAALELARELAASVTS